MQHLGCTKSERNHHQENRATRKIHHQQPWNSKGNLSDKRKIIPDGNLDLHRRMNSTGDGNYIEHQIFSSVILIYLEEKCLNKINNVRWVLYRKVKCMTKIAQKPKWKKRNALFWEFYTMKWCNITRRETGKMYTSSWQTIAHRTIGSQTAFALSVW